jgi:hypothetical protein
MSRMPFAERYARECDSVLAGTPYRAAANDGAARKRLETAFNCVELTWREGVLRFYLKVHVVRPNCC